MSTSQCRILYPAMSTSQRQEWHLRLKHHVDLRKVSDDTRGDDRRRSALTVTRHAPSCAISSLVLIINEDLSAIEATPSYFDHCFTFHEAKRESRCLASTSMNQPRMSLQWRQPKKRCHVPSRRTLYRQASAIQTIQTILPFRAPRCRIGQEVAWWSTPDRPFWAAMAAIDPRSMTTWAAGLELWTREKVKARK